MPPPDTQSSLCTALSSGCAVLFSPLQVEVFCEIGELMNQSRVLPQDHGRKFLLFKSLGMALSIKCNIVTYKITVVSGLLLPVAHCTAAFANAWWFGDVVLSVRGSPCTSSCFTVVQVLPSRTWSLRTWCTGSMRRDQRTRYMRFEFLMYTPTRVR